MTTILLLLLGASIIAMIWLNIVNNNLRKRNERLFQTAQYLNAALNKQQKDIRELEQEVKDMVTCAESSLPWLYISRYNITTPIYDDIQTILSHVRNLANKVRVNEATKSFLNKSIASLKEKLAEYKEKEKRLRKLTECEKAAIEDATRDNKALEIAIRHAVELAKQGEDVKSQLNNNDNEQTE